MKRQVMSKALVAVLMSGVSAVAQDAVPTSTVKQWPATQGGNDHWYEIYVQRRDLTWGEAEMLALVRGGRLATLTTKAENEFVLDLARGVKDAWSPVQGGNALGPWIGAIKDRGSRGQLDGWRWVTDEPFAEVFWATGYAPQRNDDLRLRLYPTGWGDSKEDLRDMRACVIEYGPGGRPVGYTPPLISQWKAADGGNDHFYEVCVRPRGMTWIEADRAARQLGGHLATLTTRDENKFVSELAKSIGRAWKGPGSAALGPWIGAYRDEDVAIPDEGWHWVTDEPFTDTFWAPGNPPDGRGETAVQLWATGWDDLRRSDKLSSCIVEYGPKGKPVGYTPPMLAQWKRADGGNNHYYRVYLQPGGMTWDEADRAARRSGGYLATLTTLDENRFVLGMARAIEGAWSDANGPWIGGYKDANAKGPEEGWQWVSGEPFSDAFWAPGNAPERGGNKRLQLFAFGWDDVNADTDRVSCIIEYGKDPSAVAFPNPSTDAAKHPATKAIQTYLEMLNRGSARAAIDRFWSMDGFLKRIFGEEFDQLPSPVRARMRQLLTSHLESLLEQPTVWQVYRKATFTDFLVTSEQDDLGSLLIEFKAHLPEKRGGVRAWLVVDKIGAKWVVLDVGNETQRSLAGALATSYKQSGLTAVKFVESLVAPH